MDVFIDGHNLSRSIGAFSSYLTGELGWTRIEDLDELRPGALADTRCPPGSPRPGQERSLAECAARRHIHRATMPVPLSVLGLAFVGSGQSPRDALEASVALAQRAEELGYRRVWYAEHHNMARIAS